MDFDGDGQHDVLSGSWPGQLYFFRGMSDGRFAPGAKIKNHEGEEIRPGSASTVFAADCNGDGAIDLVLGNIDGEVQVIRNEGTTQKPAFGKPTKIEVAGQPIKVTHGDSHPVLADWDRDGKLDLVVGTGAGSVVWFRNTGSIKEPLFAAAQTLVPESASTNPVRKGNAGCGTRAKICLTDWNSDGRLDLLVGDFTYTQGEAPKLSAEEKQAVDEANGKMTKLQAKWQSFIQDYIKLNNVPAKETAEAKKEREAKLKEAQAKLKEYQEEMRPIQLAMMKGMAKPEFHGHVWLFLRTAEAAAAPK